LLADRYRIVALIGRGGMGEVYRAEDLKLDQDVALKFLPEKLVQDGAALARFHREVRIARDISHPNVCRVFDIGEANGVPFISMEYVDGEDLSTLLRRIGRLPQDKAIDISRQLCAGVAAAHDHGVLHRDLKPANVMLDDRGKIRIMDFGLAGIASEIHGAEISSGTPAYMAPEQLASKEVTVQSDIYALGLVLYEIFTGKRAFEAATIADLIRLREHSSPTNPSEVVRDLDPLVVRVIQRCLDNDPLRRPKTALQVSAALPGGDPLAAALAAGETPSPQMVAAAGGEQALSPTMAWSVLGITIAFLVVTLWVAGYANDVTLYPIDKPPEVLQDRAREVATQAGYSGAPVDQFWGFARNTSYLHYRETEKMPSPKGQPITGSNPGALSFTYRESPAPLVAFESGIVSMSDPPLETSGMVAVVLDSVGRLETFRAVPTQVEANETAAEPNWRTMFQAAGLNLDSFKPANPKWLPPEPFDVQRGWDGSFEGDATPVHVEGASFRGKVVYFDVLRPWNRSPVWTHVGSAARTHTISLVTYVVGGFIMLALAITFARKNLKLGRGDRKGAFALALFYFLVGTAGRLLTRHHVADLNAEFSLLVYLAEISLFVSALLWIYYVALEPYVRRSWPEYLISWTRFLSGNLGNPMVGRDLMVGSLFGILLALCGEVINAFPAWFNLAGQTPINGDKLSMYAAPQCAGYLILNIIGGIFTGLNLLFALFVLRSRIKNYWIAVTILGFLITLTSLGNENVVVETIAAVIAAILLVTVIARFGLLAAIVACTCNNILVDFPIGTDLGHWYFYRGLIPVLLVLGLALYGFRTSLGSRPVFPALTADD
jgi:serine/threonine-protein kinase